MPYCAVSAIVPLASLLWLHAYGPRLITSFAFIGENLNVCMLSGSFHLYSSLIVGFPDTTFSPIVVKYSLNDSGEIVVTTLSFPGAGNTVLIAFHISFGFFECSFMML